MEFQIELMEEFTGLFARVFIANVLKAVFGMSDMSVPRPSSKNKISKDVLYKFPVVDRRYV